MSIYRKTDKPIYKHARKKLIFLRAREIELNNDWRAIVRFSTPSNDIILAFETMYIYIAKLFFYPRKHYEIRTVFEIRKIPTHPHNNYLLS